MSPLDSHTLDDLKRQLHEASEHFEQARHAWEASLHNSEFRHQQRIDIARDQLRQAERDVEAIEEKIRRALAGEGDAMKLN